MFEQFSKIANGIVRDMYQAIFDLNSTAILTDEKGEIVYVWKNISAFDEYILDMEVGESVYEKEKEMLQIYNSCLEDHFSEFTIKSNKGTAMYAFACPVHDTDKSIMASVFFLNPLNTGNVGTIRSVLRMASIAIEGEWAAIQYKEDYEAMYSRFLGVMETVPISTFVTDEQLEITDVNEATLRLLDIEKDKVIGENIDTLFQCGNFFKSCMEEKRAVMDKQMEFEFANGSLDCEVLISYLNTHIKNQNKGMVVKLKNSKYLRTYKPSKDFNEAKFYFEDIIGESKELKEVIRLGKIASRSMSNVMLRGESGTGKELFAQAIHNYSLRKEGPFVAVNCGAISSTLIESELFGYEPGTFTGASAEGKKGKFEQANGGTLFLDEIGDMPLENQATLLRCLQNKEVVRLGGNRPIKTNVRIIAATNRDVEKMVQDGSFRRDLYYRLNVFSLDIPSLSERSGDIIPLSMNFIEKYNVVLDKNIKGIDEEAERVLEAHSWMGNIRELENVIERAINIAETYKICLSDLPKNLRISHESLKTAEKETKELNKIQLIEKKEIINELIHNGGNISKTADSLKIGRRSIYRRLKSYGIKAEEYKN